METREEQQFVSYELEHHIAVVRIDRSPVNALSEDVRRQLDETFTFLALQDDVNVIVLTGGKVFSAGVDVYQLHADSPSNAPTRNARYQASFAKVEDCRQPVIAAINGYALGGGLELAMFCDVRVASEDALVGLPEIKLGGVPGIGGMQRLSRLVGEGKAKQLVLTGQPISSGLAREFGLIDEVAPSGEALETAMTIAKAMAANPRLSLQAAKRAMTLGRDLPLERAQRIDLEYVAAVADTKDRLERLNDFVEKKRRRRTSAETPDNAEKV